MFKNLVEPVDGDDVSLSKGKWRVRVNGAKVTLVYVPDL
jgi:hypothetical protein